MGKLRRAQELRVDAFSVQKCRESHDTIQKLTSQIQELQERVKCMNDAGEIQDIESYCSGNFLTFPVNRQSFQVLDLCQAATNRLPLDTWNLSEPQGNVFGNPRPMFDSSQTPYQGILHPTNQSATGAIPVQGSTVRPVARGEERIGSTTPMRMSAGRPSTMNSFLPAEIPQISMAVQQRLQISEFQFDKFNTTSTFS